MTDYKKPINSVVERKNIKSAMLDVLFERNTKNEPSSKFIVGQRVRIHNNNPKLNEALNIFESVTGNITECVNTKNGFWKIKFDNPVVMGFSTISEDIFHESTIQGI